MLSSPPSRTRASPTPAGTQSHQQASQLLRLEAQLDALRGESAALVREQEDLRSELQDLAAKQQAAEEATAVAEKECLDVEEEIRAVEQASQAERGPRQAQTEAVAACGADIVQLQCKRDTLLAEVAHVKSGANHMQAQVERLDRDIGPARDAALRLQVEVEQLRQERGDRRGERAGLLEGCADLRRRDKQQYTFAHELEGQLASLTNMYTRQGSQLNDGQRSFSDLQAQLHGQVSDARTRLEQLADVVPAEVEAARNEAKQCARVASERRSELEALTLEVAGLRTQQAKTEQKVAELSTESEQAQDKHSAARRARLAAEHALDSVNAATKGLLKQIAAMEEQNDAALMEVQALEMEGASSWIPQNESHVRERKAADAAAEAAAAVAFRRINASVRRSTKTKG